MNVSELVSQNFIHYQDYLYVKDVYLTDNFKIPSSVLQTGAAAYLSKSSINWKHIHHQGVGLQVTLLLCNVWIYKDMSGAGLL